VGSALLVVDGTDSSLHRKAEFALAPGRVGGRRLSKLVSLSREVYNAVVEHRRNAWRTAKVSVSRFDEFNEIPEMRVLRPDVASFGNQFVRGAISRADEAFAGFFRRVGDGETPGFPRFKSHTRFRTVFYDEPVGWAVRRLEGDDPAFYVQGVGEISLSRPAVAQLRRLAARGGEPRTLSITKTTSGAFRACVGFRGVAPKPLATNHQVGGVDRGICVTAALSDGTLLEMPKFLARSRDEIAALQRERETHERFGSEWNTCNRGVAKAHRRARQLSQNWARHAAIDIVERFDVIAIEALGLKNMTRSARGTIEHPGKGVSAKRGLNRSLCDAALGRLAYWIQVKAEEAGRRVYKVDPKNTSRTCICCGNLDAANRHRTRFSCTGCGHEEHADVNAAQVIAARGEAADATWQALGRPSLARPIPRNRRRKAVPPEIQEAGSAPHAQVA
jgi:putative transposase